jgi:hypothetical protein
MPIVQINTPNLIADLAQIDTFIGDVEAARALTFDDIINECFSLKPTQDCDTLQLFDDTDYNELEPVNLDNLTITVSLSREDSCGSTVICSGIQVLPNTTQTFDSLDKDGLYCSSVQLDYLRDGTLYTKIIYPSYETDCCAELFHSLASTMKSKMASIGCTIVKYSKIGRKITKLKKSYLRISNLKWVYDNSLDACSERDKVYCLYNKIK